MALAACGGSDSAVEASKIENGVSGAKDNRIVLSSESENQLHTIPQGPFKGIRISSKKLAEMIEEQVKAVSKVTNVSFRNNIHTSFSTAQGESFNEEVLKNMFAMMIISFSVTTSTGVIYEGVECRSLVAPLAFDEKAIRAFEEHRGEGTDAALVLWTCESDQVVFARKVLEIDMTDVVAVDDKNRYINMFRELRGLY